MKNIAIYGSTGSIGTSTLNVIRDNKEIFNVRVLVARKNVSKLIEQIEEFEPKYVYIESSKNAKILNDKFPDLKVYYGPEGMKEISNITDYDVFVSALVGVSRVTSHI